MRIKITRVHDDAVLPSYAHGSAEDAGMDLHAVADVTLRPATPALVPTGLAVELPAGYEAQIRPRSGLAFKHAITLPNSPATIDPGYRGEIRVILLNLGHEDYTIRKGDRIAQIVIARYEAVEWEEADLSDSARGTGVWIVRTVSCCPQNDHFKQPVTKYDYNSLMTEISVSKFKEQCLSLMDRLQPEGLLVTKHGKPIARVIPADSGCAALIGSMKGKVKVAGDLLSTGVRWNAES